MLIQTTSAPAGIFRIEMVPSLDGTVLVTISGNRNNENLGMRLEHLHGAGPCGDLIGALLAIGMAVGHEMDVRRVRLPESHDLGNSHTQRVHNIFCGPKRPGRT